MLFNLFIIKIVSSYIFYFGLLVMNCILAFKQKEHYGAYLSGFSIRLKKRFFLGLIINALIAIVVLIQYLLSPQSYSREVLAWFGIRTILSAVWIVGIYYILRRLSRYSKYSRMIDLTLDVVGMITSANMLSVLGSVQCEYYGSMGLYVYGWSQGLLFVSVISIIGSWRLKALGTFLQIGFFIVSLFREYQAGAEVVTIRLVQVLIMYIAVIYIEERYERSDFLEKRKIYEDSEAIKTILNDITEGILIVSPERQILYANKPVEQMFGLKELTLQDLFSQIKVVSASHNILKSAVEKSALEVSLGQVNS